MLLGVPQQRLVSACLLAGSLWLTGCGNSVTPAEQAAIHAKSSEAYLQQGQYRAAMIEARNAIKNAPKDPEGYLLLAQMYNDLGDAKSAVEVLDRSPDGSSVAASMERAEAYLQLAKFRSAEEALTAVQESAQTQAPEHWQLLWAQALAGSSRSQEARDLYRQLLNTPEADRARLELARLELLEQQPEQAEQLLQQIESNSSSFAEAMQLRAIIAYRANELESAERLLTDALSALPQTDIITPVKARVLRQLADTLTQLGRSSEALVYSKLLAEAVPGMQERRQKFNHALELYRTGNLEEAERLLAELYELNPASDSSGLLLGLVRYQRGEYAGAGELFEQHIDTETTSPQLIEAAALAQLRQQRLGEALNLLRQALHDHPESPDLLAIYGMAALRDPDQRDDGALAIQKALALEPKRSQLRLPLANYYLQTDKPEQAQAQLQTAANDSPDDARLQSAYVNFLLTQGEFEKARRAARRYLDSSQQATEALVLQGQVEAAASEYDAARKAFQAAQKKTPDSLAASEGLAQLALREQRWQDAIEQFRHATTLAPDQPKAYKGLMTAFEANGNREGGIQALTALSQQALQAPTAQAVLAEYYLRSEQLEAAGTSIDKALAIGRELTYVQRTAAAVYRAQARAAQDSGDNNHARSRLMAALELYPENVGLLSDLVVVELAGGNKKEAQRIIDRIHQQPGGSIPATLMTAYAQQQQGDAQAAIATLQQSWERQPAPALAERLYQLLRTTQQDDAALALARDWATRFNRDPRPLTYIGLSAQQRGDKAQAQSYYEQAHELTPNNPLLMNNLAWLYFERGDQRANALAKRASELAPDNAEILDTYGWILVQTGERQRGLELLERAASIAPDSQDIAEHLRLARGQ